MKLEFDVTVGTEFTNALLKCSFKCEVKLSEPYKANWDEFNKNYSAVCSIIPSFDKNSLIAVFERIDTLENEQYIRNGYNLEEKNAEFLEEVKKFTNAFSRFLEVANKKINEQINIVDLIKKKKPL